ncbi:hypothetical protein AQUCO_04100088v1 [Aquilegia coerulea]|uniref:Uncharacterized protein n=1 Tax=Aquilegia coerulea TaxID=218851 RepID=A0A2G5CQ41_AQUCA|nr:hypothetical protein AQUCO_04100088v1 [Aquilegia coerulea]
MVRQWKDEVFGYEGANIGGGDVILLIWAIMITFSLISFIIFSCSDGASKDKTSSATDTHVYGSGCAAAGCGAACGG